MSEQFVHLHVHTQFSLLDGACRVKALVAKAAEYGMPALAMTDHGNMSATIPFYQACKKHGIKPIIGSEVYLAPRSRHEKSGGQKGTSHLILLAKNNIGYRNLIKIVSAGFMEGFYYKPRVDKEILYKHREGIICSSACMKGEVNWKLWHDNDYEAAKKSAQEFKDIFGDDFYLELADHGIPEQQIVMDGAIKLSKELDIPLVATNDVHYMTHEQAEAHDILLCIQLQTTVNDTNRMRSKSDQLYFKSQQEMRDLFKWIPEACDNTLRIADECNVEIDFDTYHLPKFNPPDKELTPKDYFLKLCEKGIQWRYGEETQEIRERLEHEIKIIDEMGFISYFLIVWDFCNYARENDIPVGPGRGSAAGSLVSYLLGITSLCPLKYDLLFERFLNPSRAGMPDIDIDFCPERRQQVIDYVTEKYGGQYNVAQIITFGTLQAKAAVRDVGRALGMSYGEVDAVAKLIPNELGIKLDEAIDAEPRLRELMAQDEMVNKLMENAQVLEGLMRHASTHAAGVVISDDDLTDHVPLFKADDQVSCAYAKEGVETVGLLKMDFLGLRNLTVIDGAIKMIKRTKGIELTADEIPLDNELMYEMLGRGDSLGVFQLESGGMRELLRKLKPTEFDDIVAVLALYRPGPMGSGMLDDFIERKRGRQDVKYPHPKLEECLKPSYGIILYQEQVMQIPVTLAGFELAEADNLRRAMSKKKFDVMNQMRTLFVKGCADHSGMSEKDSNDLFDLIDYFSGYGFNKSHSAAYALVTCQTAYLKANYPEEFMCSLLTSERDNMDKIVPYVHECKRMGIEILPPDVNHSFKEFTVIGKNQIRFGLLAVKNVGGNAIQSIIDAREQGGPFTSIFDFCRRIDLRLNNNRVVESLIKAGCFRSIPGTRAQQMAVLEKAMNLGSKSQEEKEIGQISFFDMGDDQGFDTAADEKLPDIKDWPQAQVLSYEKELLGFYLSGHPLDRYKVETRHFTDCSTKKLASCPEDQAVKLVGMITFVKLTATKRTGERMAIIRFEDMEGEVEGVVFPRAFKEIAPALKEGAIVVIQGTVNIRDESVGLIVNQLCDINEVYQNIRAIHIDLSKTNKEDLALLKNKLQRFPGRVPVYLKMSANKYKNVEIKVGDNLFVSPSEILMDDIKQLVGEDCFTVRL